MAKPKLEPVDQPLPGADNAPPAASTPLQALASSVEQETTVAQGVTDADVAGIPVEGETPAIPNAALVAQLVGAVRDTVCMFAGLEAPKRTLTDDKVEKLGVIWGGVLDHYKIVLSDKMGTYGPIVAAAMASAPLLRDCVMETRAEIAEKDGHRPRLPAAAPGPVTAAAAPPPPAAANNPGYADGVIKPRWTPQ